MRFWVLLQHEDKREMFRCSSNALEVIALDVFAKNGWQSTNRLCLREAYAYAWPSVQLMIVGLLLCFGWGEIGMRRGCAGVAI